jgi:hypothetical protein
MLPLITKSQNNNPEQKSELLGFGFSIKISVNELPLK